MSNPLNSRDKQEMARMLRVLATALENDMAYIHSVGVDMQGQKERIPGMRSVLVSVSPRLTIDVEVFGEAAQLLFEKDTK